MGMHIFLFKLFLTAHYIFIQNTNYLKMNFIIIAWRCILITTLLRLGKNYSR